MISIWTCKENLIRKVKFDLQLCSPGTCPVAYGVVRHLLSRIRLVSNVFGASRNLSEHLEASRSLACQTDNLACQVAYRMVRHWTSTFVALGPRLYTAQFDLSNGVQDGTPLDKYLSCSRLYTARFNCLNENKDAPKQESDKHLRSLARPSEARPHRAKRGRRRRRPAPEAPPSLARAADES